MDKVHRVLEMMIQDYVIIIKKYKKERKKERKIKSFDAWSSKKYTFEKKINTKLRKE